MERVIVFLFFFPAYNGEENIEKMWSSLQAAFPRAAEDVEVIIVNDGSEDRTGRLPARTDLVNQLLSFFCTPIS